MSGPITTDSCASDGSAKQRLKRPLVVWLCHDHRAGHISQLSGLIKALAKQTGVEQYWFDAESLRTRFSRLLRPQNGKTSPDIVIGAGHRTHKCLLMASRAHKALSIVIMKPSLPLRLFDGVICPQHDGLSNNTRILCTQGPITKIEPPQAQQQRTQHLMIIGGPSKHFDWNQAALIKQVQEVCAAKPGLSWYLSDSPRTPESFIDSLLALGIANLNCHRHQDERFGSIGDALHISAFTWVTPDSMSMIYESLTAGAPTALFSLEPKPKAAYKRICRHVSELLESKLVTSFEHWQAKHDKQFYPRQAPPLDEAQKAARWVLAKFQQTRPL